MTEKIAHIEASLDKDAIQTIQTLSEGLNSVVKNYQAAAQLLKEL